MPSRRLRPLHRLRQTRGFTLVELLVVLAIVALLLTLAVPRYFHSIDQARETILIDNLATVRSTIDKFYGDTGRYPDSLEELVEKKYLRTLPFDPVANSSTAWVLIPPTMRAVAVSTTCAAARAAAGAVAPRSWSARWHDTARALRDSPTLAWS